MTATVVLVDDHAMFRSGVRAELGDRVQLVPVTIGHDFGNAVEITSGLTPADEVILDPSDSLASGTEVHPQAVSPRGQS